jgi:drug/metabolite transporter superfamily protein YnfA
MLVALTARRRTPARWIARWMLALAVCLTLAAEAAAPAGPVHAATGGQTASVTHR